MGGEEKERLLNGKDEDVSLSSYGSFYGTSYRAADCSRSRPMTGECIM